MDKGPDKGPGPTRSDGSESPGVRAIGGRKGQPYRSRDVLEGRTTRRTEAVSGRGYMCATGDPQQTINRNGPSASRSGGSIGIARTTPIARTLLLRPSVRLTTYQAHVLAGARRGAAGGVRDRLPFGPTGDGRGRLKSNQPSLHGTQCGSILGCTNAWMGSVHGELPN